MLAPPWARAVYDRRKRQTACELETCLQASGRGVGALTVSLDSQGMPLIRHTGHAIKPCGCARL